MTPEQHLKQGDIDSALKLLQDQVRKNPASAKHRIFLFQLLAVFGQWDRAMTQLNVVGDLDDGALAMVYMYREVLNCEVFREQVFQGLREPVVFGQPPEWIGLLVQALKLTAKKKDAESQKFRNEAFESAAESVGEINGQSFVWIADADSRLGPVLEVIIEGRYFWVPFQNIRSINIEQPEDLRDMVWLPAHFTWSNSGESYGLIPTRYPESYEHEDPLLALSRKTEWKECGADMFFGFGQRLLSTDTGDFPLMEVRTVKIDAEKG